MEASSYLRDIDAQLRDDSKIHLETLKNPQNSSEQALNTTDRQICFQEYMAAILARHALKRVFEERKPPEDRLLLLFAERYLRQPQCSRELESLWQEQVKKNQFKEVVPVHAITRSALIIVREKMKELLPQVVEAETTESVNNEKAEENIDVTGTQSLLVVLRPYATEKREHLMEVGMGIQRLEVARTKQENGEVEVGEDVQRWQKQEMRLLMKEQNERLIQYMAQALVNGLLEKAWIQRMYKSKKAFKWVCNKLRAPNEVTFRIAEEEWQRFLYISDPYTIRTCPAHHHVIVKASELAQNFLRAMLND